jgi:NTE family protein
MTKRAVVLGGGGVAGIAWEAGIIDGLRQTGVDLGTADMFVGTSAGSVTGALLATGADLWEMIEHQIAADTAPAPMADMAEVMAAFAILFDTTIERQEARRRVGEMALNAQVVDSARRLEAIGERLPVKEWPADRELKITTVDAETGEFVVWSRETEAPLVKAVASSCAVPMVFPPVEIAGRRYMDGGVRSGTSADLAKGADVVVVLEPLGGMMPPEILAGELAATGAETTFVVRPDAAAVAVFGDNVLDPALWGSAYKAGLAQAPAVADDVRIVWST